MNEFLFSLLLALSMAAGSGQASDFSCRWGQIPGQFPPHATYICELKTGDEVWVTATGLVFVNLPNPPPMPIPPNTY